MKMLLCVSLFLLPSLVQAQKVDWKRFSRMMNNGDYISLYDEAKALYDSHIDGSQRLAAAYWMARAAERYQEDPYDSAVARYRALLPELDTLDRALCYAFLGSYDTALMNTEVLKRTPVSAIENYCEGGKTHNMTPTAYDVIVTMMQDRGNLTRRERTMWQRRLCEFHRNDNDDIRIWHDLRLIDYLNVFTNTSFSLDTVQTYINKYRGTKSQLYTKLYYTMAHGLIDKNDYVRALAYCDTAVRLAPKSEGGVECTNFIAAISKTVEFGVETDDLTVYPGERSLLTVIYRNADHLWFRIVPYYEDFQYDVKEPDRMRGMKPLVEWNQAVPTNSEYRGELARVVMPALKTGRYTLLVSPTADFKKHGLMAYEVNCTDMQLVECGQDGLLLDRKTGRPIVGQEVKVVKIRYIKEDTALVATTHTDRNGRFHFDEDYDWRTKLMIDRNGYRLLAPYSIYTTGDTSWRQSVEVRMDRPIYKPGDTAHAAVVYYVSNGFEAMSGQFFQVRYVLRDPNGQEVLTDSVKTDSYGIASFQFVLPKDRLPGIYRLHIYNYNQHKTSVALRVEEYKQPKFMVTMATDGADAAPEFGKPYTVKGMAASYSAVPVSGAKVKYTVERRQLSRLWWYYGTMASLTTVASGETATAADGSFEVTFTPEPDSCVDFGLKPCFQYHISVDVTDINGESHPASTTVRVGFRNAFIALDGDVQVRTLDGLKPRFLDLNGNTLPGEVEMKIELLRQPDVPLLDLRSGNVHQTMEESDFRKAFPLFAYSADYNNHAKWPVASLGWNGASGVYRITLTADGADTVVAYRAVTTADARKVQSQQLLWHDIDKPTAEVGDTVTLRFGSRFKDVEVYYWLRVGSEERDFRRIRVSDQLKSISIVVDSSMLGGFNFELATVREGITELQREDVSVPFSHKKLNVEIATFRDRLQPGETEEWTIRVKNAGSGNSSFLTPHSSLILTMYDDALNSYGSAQYWGFSPWRVNNNHRWSHYAFECNIGWYAIEPREVSYNGNYYPSTWRLFDALPSPRLRGYVTMYGNVRRRSGVMATDEEEAAVVSCGAPEHGARITEEDILRMPGNSVESIVAAVGGVGYSDNSAMALKSQRLSDAMPSPAAGVTTAEPQVRVNLNTLAFFVAGLRTDSTGTATYRFTVPELLTRWNVRGLAVTRDIKIGTLDRTLVTSKRLMVQPNMPRFLRSGDSLALMAKVVKSSDSSDKSDESDVTVTFLLTDAATGDTICKHVQMVKVKDAAQVMFDVEVPHNVYVATYEIVAQAEGMSDGERGQLPVLPSRQAVTVSQAMYINGVGEKTYTFSLPKSATAEPRLVYAEVVSNPIWLAVKCMPYLKTMENPSTIYLANQLYINAMGRELVGLVKLDKQDLQETASPLSMNEDVKQTLLQATPWVQDAESEEEQMAAVAHYFDTASLNADLRALATELIGRQNADGGFSWMPEGRSSLWVTQQVLKMMVPCDATLLHQRQQALAYIDNEYQRDYERYIKPHLSKKHLCGATNIDYLYTRSFYGKGKTEAYKYYYDNAIKTYKEYENLYTQAQLALIFHRHGDHNAALDLLRRLKQKALKSDEMGMYWRDNRSGWWWYQRPIETQALIIQAFAEITPDDTVSIGQMQQWLLKQKQTTHWGNDAATTRAIEALLVESGERRVESGEQGVEMTVFGTKLSPLTSHLSSLEGRISQRWTGGALDTLLAAADNTVTLRKTTRGIAWASVCYQFTDELENIPASETGITLKRTYQVVSSESEVWSNQETNSSLLIPHSSFKVGDRVRVRIEISCDRAMDYLELIDGRPSCVEPLSTRAGWRWMQGLSYYITVNNTDTRCYIEHIDKGKYVFEYEVYVTNPGTFVGGPVTMQCMYAPEFRATAPAQRLTVAE